MKKIMIFLLVFAFFLSCKTKQEPINSTENVTVFDSITEQSTLPLAPNEEAIIFTIRSLDSSIKDASHEIYVSLNGAKEVNQTIAGPNISVGNAPINSTLDIDVFVIEKKKKKRSNTFNFTIPWGSYKGCQRLHVELAKCQCDGFDDKDEKASFSAEKLAGSTIIIVSGHPMVCPK